MVVLGRTCSSIIAVSSVTTILLLLHVVAHGGGPGVWGDMHNTVSLHIPSGKNGKDILPPNKRLDHLVLKLFIPKRTGSKECRVPDLYSPASQSALQP